MTIYYNPRFDLIGVLEKGNLVFVGDFYLVLTKEWINV